MASAIVDVGYLATHLGVPEANLVTVTTDPTAELVKAVLAAVAAKGHEYETLYSQKVHLEVELETNVRGAEAQRDASSETAKKALKDLDEIRQKLTHEGTSLSHAHMSSIVDCHRSMCPCLWYAVADRCHRNHATGTRERDTVHQVVQLYLSIRHRDPTRPNCFP
ncbi:hypothetical protein BJ170DRAFT_290806 [Xylariales sp. AK1849]|nr:hypothetical protein BJ170DRAFT_290806 [Xylariales sp. AK1849]